MKNRQVSNPMISCFMKGACRIHPVSRQMVPLWDLSIVLEALSQHPFEPLEGIGLKFLTFKTVLLIALVTAKHVSYLHALSVSSLLQGSLRIPFALTRLLYLR